ncbi:class I SAM-dependent methyltransferase [Dysgonomonas sp. 216]|uniref:class I SAM-dependent methyltransferase n=1 Tax=Dysgonomonas sp. 216 TaxID=2302934 RepID=UPI0013CF53A5|nr:class I SAM-dependent methyltransferase [Dysgonomonas sp. 216]NDW17546.1 class I SAM-dependent methyltransferase [Dysgonomonas sp. 216]
MKNIFYSFKNSRKRDRVLQKLHLSFFLKIKNNYKTSKNIRKNKTKDKRFLEIGPGLERLPDFETLNIIDGEDVDYIHNIFKPFPFEDNSFDLIYASHVLEHVPWFLQADVFKELYRILKPAGQLEVWVPDGWKVISSVYEFEINGINNIDKDGWYRFNDEKDVVTWANGRIFTYGDGSDDIYHPNWHRTLYTPKFLTNLFKKAGFLDVTLMDESEVRGYNHGWINLGVKGRKNDKL